MKNRHQLKIVFISLCLMLLWNIPIVMLFNSSDMIFGFPMLYFFIFSTWLLAIIITYVIILKYDK